MRSLLLEMQHVFSEKMPTKVVVVNFVPIVNWACWARIFKLVWGPEIDSKELIPRGYVAWLPNTITLFLLGS
jgi:hypothetical protein